MILRILQVILLLVLLEKTAYAWVVYDDGRYTIESQQVVEHIENVYLNNDQQIKLFNEANRDYQTYQIKKREWIDSRFPTAIKELSFYKLVEKIAYIESNRLGYFVAFRNADEIQLKKLRFVLFEELQASVQSKVYQDSQQLSLNEKIKFQKQYGKALIAKGYPRTRNEDALAVYQNWYQDQVNKLEKQAILKLTAQGIQEFEGYIQAQGYDFRFASPLEINQSYEDAQQLLSQWQAEGRSHADTFRFLKANPEVNAIVKDYYPESPRFLAIEKINQKYPHRIDEIKSIVKDAIDSLTDTEIIKETIALKDMSSEMLQDGLSDSELTDGKEQMMQEYQASGEYHYLYTARAFDLALALRALSSQELQASIQNVVIPTMQNILKNIEVAIEKETFFSESYQGYSLSESARKFATGFISSANLKEQESKLLASGIWFIKLKFENLFANFDNTVVFERQSKAEALTQLDLVLRQKRRNQVRRKAIEDYTQNLFIQVKAQKDGDIITGEELFEFLFTD